jgi:hypothetical protein
MTAAEIARRLGGAVRHGRGWLARCPVPGHGQGRGDRNPSMSLADGEGGRLLVRCFAGCDPRDILAELRNRGLIESRPDPDWRPPLPPVRDPLPTTDADAKRAFALRIWDTARPAGGTLAEAYLRSRGITLPPPPSLRFAPEMLHSPTATRWPAMVARVEDVAGRFLGVHRTYLAPGGRGKAPVEPQKMMLGATAGGAVRLGEAANGLLIAEGIESALSAMQASGRPAWAALSTSGLRRLELPEHVREVVIVPDGDPPGWDAATAAARRWDAEGWAVRIAALPDGRDINDLLRGGAA